MNILLFSGSLRTASLNKKLVHVASRILTEQSHQTKIVDLKTLAMPVYDGDIEAEGIPKGVKELGEHIAQCDALVISSPEYNWTMAGSLKNTLDWVSRLRPVPLEHKPVLLLGASPGYFGAIRALGHERSTFDSMAAYLYPSSFGLAKAGEAFTPTGELVDAGNKKRLTDLLTAYIQFAEKLKQ